MAKKLTTAEKIRRYMEAHPLAKAKQISEALGVKLPYVYVLRSNDKKLLAQGKPTRRVGARRMKIQLPMTALAPSIPAPIAPAPVAIAPMTITMAEPKDDMVNHPPHYKVGGIETIDFIEAKKLNYNLGNVVKYITRADHKGSRKQDLAKALWYLKREIEAQNA